MLTAVQFVPRPGSELSEYAVGGYAFSATLAIQDITGLATSGVTASHIAKRLEPSAESEAYLFALAENEALRPVTELGFPELTAPDLDAVHAWVFVSVPLLEDREVLEANVTLDAELAPLPGDTAPEGPWIGALSLIDALSEKLHRPIRQLWVTHAPGIHAPPGVHDAGYAEAFREDQAVFSLGSVDKRKAPCEIAVVEGPGFGGRRRAEPGELEQFSHLLTQASRDYPRGELRLEPIEWDLGRIVDAGARLSDRGGAQLTGIAYVQGAIAGMCEVVHYHSDDKRVCELGLVYVLPEHRGRGIGSALVAETLAAAAAAWDGLETVYCSYPAGSAPAEAMMRRVGAAVVSSTTAWQKL